MRRLFGAWFVCLWCALIFYCGLGCATMHQDKVSAVARDIRDIGQLLVDAAKTEMAFVATPTPTPDPPLRPTVTYIVRSGDSLWKITKDHHVDPMLWPNLWKANAPQVKDPDLIEPGTILDIPYSVPAWEIEWAMDYAENCQFHPHKNYENTP